MAWYEDCFPCVPKKTTVFVNHGHPLSSIERLCNKTNQQMSCCQTTIQEFGWRMERRFLVKGNKDKRIPKSCCDGEENVDCWEWNELFFKLIYRNQSFKCFCVCSISRYICCCYHPSVVSTLLQVILSYNEEYCVSTATSKSRSVKH